MQEKRQNEILDIRSLKVSFLQYEKKSTKKVELPVITDLNVKVYRGEIVAIVGSSGSGKSLLAHAMLGLLPRNARVRGEIRFCGECAGAQEIEKLRGREIALVPQSVNYLDPLMTVGRQIINGKKDDGTLTKMRELFARYGLGGQVEKQYPFELSGGMVRRVLLMTALINDPKLIIADEPTTGMDFALGAKAMEDFRQFADEGNGVLLITHDLKLAANVADRIVVFYAGTTVEEALATDFKEETRLRHPYTRALYRAMPGHGFCALPGTQPYVKERPVGCPFAPRCTDKSEACDGDIPVCHVRGGSVRCICYAKKFTERHGY